MIDEDNQRQTLSAALIKIMSGEPESSCCQLYKSKMSEEDQSWQASSPYIDTSSEDDPRQPSSVALHINMIYGEIKAHQV